MKKLLLILITAVVGLVAHADKTIYYDNSVTNFSPVLVPYWGGSTGTNTGTMTQVAGSIYKFDGLPDDATGFLFKKKMKGGAIPIALRMWSLSPQEICIRAR